MDLFFSTFLALCTLWNDIEFNHGFACYFLKVVMWIAVYVHILNGTHLLEWYSPDIFVSILPKIRISKITYYSNITAYFSFSFIGMDRLVRVLLSKGASVNVLSCEGTPLHVAASYGKSGIMQILLQHNADVITNLIYSSGGALLHICVTIFLLRFKWCFP
jgi:hypothetical protein